MPDSFDFFQLFIHPCWRIQFSLPAFTTGQLDVCWHWEYDGGHGGLHPLPLLHPLVHPLVHPFLHPLLHPRLHPLLHPILFNEPGNWVTPNRIANFVATILVLNCLWGWVRAASSSLKQKKGKINYIYSTQHILLQTDAENVGDGIWGLLTGIWVNAKIGNINIQIQNI